MPSKGDASTPKMVLLLLELNKLCLSSTHYHLAHKPTNMKETQHNIVVKVGNDQEDLELD
jgi:hypothetical protein